MKQSDGDIIGNMPEEPDDSHPLSPEPQPPLAPPTSSPVPTSFPWIVPDSARCLQCGYALRGLLPDRNCPECGTPIARSLRGNLLVFSSTEYVRSLHHGLIMILIAVLARLALSIGSIVVGVWLKLQTFGSSTISVSDFGLWVAIGTLPFTAMLLFGWWQFSAPDPAILGTEKGQAARTTIRVTVLILAGTALLELMVEAFATKGPNLQWLIWLTPAVNYLTDIAQFFASMIYVRWLAPRLLDRELEQQASLYMWLLPLIYVVGMLCFFLGPLVAKIMYFVMLNRIRVRLSLMRDRQRREAMGLAASR